MIKDDLFGLDEGGDLITGFKGSFDYETITDLVKHLRDHAYRTAGGSPGDSTYDPETLLLETDAADALERLRSVIAKLESEIERLKAREA